MKRSSLRWLGAIGALLSLVGLAIVFVGLVRAWQDPGSRALLIDMRWRVAGLALCYGGMCFLLANGWRLLLMQAGASLPSREAFRIYGASQLAKYVPGNVAQFASRQSIGMSAGYPAAALAKSIPMELGILAIAAVASSALSLPLLAHLPGLPGSGLSRLAREYPLVGSALSLVSACGIACILRLWKGNALALSFLNYLMFLLGAAALFAMLHSMAAGVNAFDVPAFTGVMGAYIVAWMAGMVTPGSPAGLGIREFVLGMLLAPTMQEDALVQIIAVGRLVTCCGDLIFFLASRLFSVTASR